MLFDTNHDMFFDAEAPKNMAVLLNGPTVAKWMGYEDPCETQICEVVVLDTAAVVDKFEIGEGKYLSAIWIEGWLKYRGLQRRRRRWRLGADASWSHDHRGQLLHRRAQRSETVPFLCTNRSVYWSTRPPRVFNLGRAFLLFVILPS